MSDTNVPEELSYTEDHEWVAMDSDVGTVGITDYAQSELGDIVFVELPEVGQTLRKGERFGTVEAVKTVEEIYAPLSGEVVEVNESLEADAEQVNKEPYGAGWMIRIRCSDQDELAELLSPRDYAELISGA
jgi:glycine cleavage system H protein